MVLGMLGKIKQKGNCIEILTEKDIKTVCIGNPSHWGWTNSMIIKKPLKRLFVAINAKLP